MIKFLNRHKFVLLGIILILIIPALLAIFGNNNGDVDPRQTSLETPIRMSNESEKKMDVIYEMCESRDKRILDLIDRDLSEGMLLVIQKANVRTDIVEIEIQVIEGNITENHLFHFFFNENGVFLSLELNE